MFWSDFSKTWGCADRSRLLLVFFERLDELSNVTGIDGGGQQLQILPEIRQRSFVLPGPVVGIAPIVVGRGELGLEAERLAVVEDRVVVLLQ